MVRSDNFLFSIYDLLGMTLVTRLGPQFGHLNMHKFTVYSMYLCGAENDTNDPFLLHCRLSFTQRLKLYLNHYNHESSQCKR